MTDKGFVVKDKYLELINSRLQVGTSSGSEYMCKCIFHEAVSHYTMQVNADTGLFICFSCGEAGSPKRLMRELGIPCDSQIDDVDIRQLLTYIDGLRTKKPTVVLPDENLLRRFRFAHDYWASRGITPQTVKMFDLGYNPMQKAVTIPIRNVYGELLGVIHRYLDPDAELRYRYPRAPLFRKSEHLFASWLVEELPSTTTVVLVEGAIDAIKVWQAGYPAMAIYGSKISEAQIRVLRRLGIGHVVLMFDNDAAGRRATMSCLGRKQHVTTGKLEYIKTSDMSREFVVDSVTRQQWQEVDGNDPGELSEEDIAKLLQKPYRHL